MQLSASYRRAALAALALGLTPAPSPHVAPSPLPFESGERLTYTVHAGRWGKVGHAVMEVTGPDTVRGTSVLLASFTTRVGVTVFRGGTETRSWIDPVRFASLRFAKHERRPFSSSVDSVDIYPMHRRWIARGDSGVTASDAPLDELSFIYFLRTLPLDHDTVYSFDRFYDARRIPTTVHVLGRQTVPTSAGEFTAVEVEMRVKDSRYDSGEGIVRLWLTEGCGRFPVRIESDMPVLGNGVMTLDSAVTPNCPAKH